MRRRLFFIMLMAVCRVPEICAQTPFLLDKGNGVTGDAVMIQSSTSPSNIGIRTTNPRQPLEVSGPIISGGLYNADYMFMGLDWLSFNRDPTNGTIYNPNAYSFTFAHNTNASGGQAGINPNEALLMQVFNPSGSLVSVNALTIFKNGNIGVATSTPGADIAALPQPPSASTPIFEVNGDIAISQGHGGAMYFQDGTVQSTAWNGTTLGGDYAESVDVLGDRAKYEPGDLIIIDASSPGNFTKSSSTYSRLVAGVFSTKPGLVGRRVTAARPDKEAEVPMAMMGIVPTKVSTENGPIAPGDLLVTSSTPGYAMKGTDSGRLTGAVIGKALASLDKGLGVIEVLISLQ